MMSFLNKAVDVQAIRLATSPEEDCSFGNFAKVVIYQSFTWVILLHFEDPPEEGKLGTFCQYVCIVIL